MKAYLVITGLVFGALTFAHIARIVAEGSQLATEPVFMLITIAAAALCIWAILLLGRSSR